MIIDKLDTEFKMFLRWRGFNIDSQIFDLVFEEPQNFAQYRQADVDAARIGTFTQLEGFPYLSKRFLMQRYLGMSEAEIAENEIMWKEEQGKADTSATDDPSLRNVGITPGGIEGDLEAAEVPDDAEVDVDAGASAEAPVDTGADSGVDAAGNPL